MKTFFVCMVLFTGLSFAATDNIECEFKYLRNGVLESDVLTSEGQQSTKIEGFVSRVSQVQSVWSEEKSCSERRYVVSLYEVNVGGLDRIEYLDISEQDLNNALNVGARIKASKIKLKNTEISINCIRR